MAIDLSEAMQSLMHERGLSEELVKKTVEDFLIAAYKKHFGTAENVIVEFSDDGYQVSLFSKKIVVDDDDFDDDVTQIPLTEAKELTAEAEAGDEIILEIDPKTFDRGSVQVAKQRAQQEIKDIQRDTLYSEFKDKVGEVIIGYYQRESNGNIYVDLGKTEGILPKKYQSPREVYKANDKIRALVYEVNKRSSGLQIVLSRTHPEFIKKILEAEVPEIYDKTVEIYKIVREPGYRTKIAVFSRKEGVDPVGACVGVKGSRIQALVNELEGERVDVIRYSPDPVVFIKEALSPAQVERVIVIDKDKKHAVAIVKDNQLSLAIGKQGLNVRLANRLLDWIIDVNTVEQAQENGILSGAIEAMEAVFSNTEEETEEITRIDELPGFPPELVRLLEDNNIVEIEELVYRFTEGELASLDGMTDEYMQIIEKVLEDSVEIIEEEPDNEESENAPEVEADEEYFCPECSAPISTDMAECPNCGVELIFAEEEIEEEE
ncbi:transcription termination factor NusA [Spirochaetia bacterium 38H-sp]|uniref:Transcription termination/antitermination protein NusA n=1 Tax=Rarispira pelagica TaxID=3141764 RepID=A0ABU9UAX2_9SPIR